MLTAAVLTPLLGALVLALVPRWRPGPARLFAVAVAAVPLVLLILTWTGFDIGSDQLFQMVEEAPWIPALDAGWRLGVDGIALAVATLTALLFVAAIAYPVDERGRTRQYLAWFLFLEAVSVGLFLSLDLLLFYVFFDLSLVGMYFLIGMWGHADAQRAALKFFLFTLAGSLALLLGILGLVLATDPISFDMRVMIAEQPLAGEGLRAGLVFLGLGVGLAVKTPLVPVHTWLPAAHVEAPAPASTILAGVLLKMGTFGLIRIPFAMMRDTFARYALVVGILGVVSIVYGALVAFGQRHIKRRIAYTSVTHMGYTVLGIAAAATVVAGAEEARRLALTGATIEMVAHGLITGALFLITGSLWSRTREYEMDRYGGLAGRAPLLTAATVLAAFASLGLPALAGFVAEFQIFTGTLAVRPWLAGIGLLGVLITAALFLQLLQEVFLGERPGRLDDFTDLRARELWPLGVLLLLVVVIGVAPAWLVDTIQATSTLLVGSF